jgi:5-methylcytosine-specific restriction protein B
VFCYAPAGLPPIYAYEDFVEGYKPRPTSAGGLELELREGIFKRLCRAAADDPTGRTCW